MPSRPNFSARLRAYTPLGDPGQVIPDLGIEITSAPDGPTLQATVSTVTYRALPHDLEVAVEVFDDVANAWVEGRDSRFVVLTQQGDERDVTQTTTLGGIGLMQWLTQRAALAGVTPLQANGAVESAASIATAHVSGKTFTWSAHILGEGDRIRITDSGKAKGLTKGSVYFVRNPGTSTFQVSQTQTGAIKSFGSSTKVGLSRVRTRINIKGNPFAKNQAISVWDATSKQNLTNGSQYYVVNPTANTLQVATKPGGIPIELVADNLLVYRYLDGARVFSSQTPGQVIGDSFLEARNRGWGQDAGGNDQVFHSWTNAGDSNSLVWPARVDDPTVTGVAVSFQPGTTLWDQTSFMLDNGWAEFASHGRTLDLFAPLTGADLSSTHRIGSSATSVPKSVDLTNYATTEIVRGDGPVEVAAKVARSPWGVLEVYATAAGVGSSAAAKSYGNGNLADHQSATVGWTVTEQATAATWLPALDYQRGDWVSAYVEGAWTKLRVVQWTLVKATDGTATVSAVLQSKTRHVLKKLAGAAKKANGGRVAITTSTTPQESDKRKAAIPGNLAVTARSKSAADKSAAGTLTASWAAVTQDEDGNDLVGAHYEVTVRADGAQDGSVVTTTTALHADLPAIATGETVAVSVRAISNTGTYGEATPEVEYVVDAPGPQPDSPTTPIVSSTLGSMTIAWDGNLVDAIDGPHAPAQDDALAYVLVQRSPDEQTWTTETQPLTTAGSVVDLGLSVGTTYFYQLIAVSQLGVVSAPSPVASSQVVPIDVEQINADFTAAVTQAGTQSAAAITAAANALTVGQGAQAAGAAAAAAAAGAQTTADGKNGVVYSAAAASGSGKTVGDLWWQVDSNGHVIAQWTWTGNPAAWMPTQISGTVVTNLDAGSISTGTLNAQRIAAGTITGAQLVANTITASQIAANTITAAQIAANTITAGNIAAGTINAAQLSGTAIDGMTITGATVQTASTATTSGGVILNSTGITGYNASGIATFRVDNNGNTSMTGTVHATAGSIDGLLSIGTSGGIQATRADGLVTTLNQAGITIKWGANGNTQLQPGQLYVDDGAGRSATLQVDAGGRAQVTGTNGVTLNGSVSVPNSYLQVPDAYTRVETARALYINSAGTLGTTSSSRRTKNLHRHLKMDDTVLERWLGLPTWEFEYKPESAPDSPGIHHGLVAEEVEEAGFAHLVYYDERPDSETPGQVDGFAYERMGVYNHMALKRLYARLQAAEQKLAAVTGKA